jgi:hypothetical protein
MGDEASSSLFAGEGDCFAALAMTATLRSTLILSKGRGKFFLRHQAFAGCVSSFFMSIYAIVHRESIYVPHMAEASPM